MLQVWWAQISVSHAFFWNGRLHVPWNFVELCRINTINKKKKIDRHRHLFFQIFISRRARNHHNDNFYSWRRRWGLENNNDDDNGSWTINRFGTWSNLEASMNAPGGDRRSFTETQQQQQVELTREMVDDAIQKAKNDPQQQQQLQLGDTLDDGIFDPFAADPSCDNHNDGNGNGHPDEYWQPPDSTIETKLMDVSCSFGGKGPSSKNNTDDDDNGICSSQDGDDDDDTTTNGFDEDVRNKKRKRKKSLSINIGVHIKLY